MRAAPLLCVITIMRWKWHGSLATLVRRVCLWGESYSGRAGVRGVRGTRGRAGTWWFWTWLKPVLSGLGQMTGTL